MKKTRSFTRACLALLSSLITLPSFASSGITFQGVIKTPSGQYPTMSDLKVTAQIISPNNCVLREETFSNVAIKDGYLNLAIGEGQTPAGKPDLARSLAVVMSNSKSFNGLTCTDTVGAVSSVTAYNPQAGDHRKLRISMEINQDQVVADFNMRSVAFAVNAKTLNGKVDNEFINVNENAKVTQENIESIFNRYTQLDNILKGFNSAGSSASIDVTGKAENVTGVVAITNGGTGASTLEGAKINLGLKELASLALPTVDPTTKYLRGDGSWQPVVGGVASVNGKAGVVVLETADIADFDTSVNTKSDARIASQKGQNNGLASLDSGGKVARSQLQLAATDIPDLDASKITTGTITNNIQASNVTATVGTFTSQKIYDGASKYLTQTRQAGGDNYVISWPMNQGMNNSVLMNDGSGQLSWSSIPVTTVAGRTGNVVLSVSDISGLKDSASIDTTDAANITKGVLPFERLPVGTAANTVVVGNDSRLTNARTPTGSADGDLTGTYPSPSVVAIRGNSVAVGTLVSGDAGKVYRWNGSNFASSFLTFGDLRTSTGSQQLGAICAANQKIQWSVITDTFTCQAIGSLNASAITDGTISDDRLPASAKAWGAATGGVNYTGGNVGVGASNPGAKLEVAGGVKIGDDVGTCNSAKAGTMKFVSPNMFVCNGTAWKIVQLIDPVANVVLISGTGSGMDVAGTIAGTTVTGTPVTFTYQNTGGANTVAISTSLSSSTNFEITADTCNGQILTPSSTCTVTVRPKASANGSLGVNLVLNW